MGSTGKLPGQGDDDEEHSFLALWLAKQAQTMEPGPECTLAQHLRTCQVCTGACEGTCPSASAESGVSEKR